MDPAATAARSSPHLPAPPPADGATTDGAITLTGLVTAVFSSWRAQRIAFVVLRNYDGLPARTTNDIDVLVRSTERPIAEALMVAAARQAGYILHNRVRFSPVSYFFYHARTQHQVQIDLFSDLEWHCLPLLPAEAVLEARQGRALFDIPDPIHEAVINLLTRLIYVGQVRQEYRSSIRGTFRAAPHRAQQTIAVIIGHRLARECVALSLDERWGDVERLSSSLRRALVWRRVTKEPVRTLRAMIGGVSRFIERAVHAPGLTVRLIHAPHAPVTGLAEALIDRLRHTFNPGKGLRHWDGPAANWRERLRRAVRSRLARFRNGLVLLEHVGHGPAGAENPRAGRGGALRALSQPVDLVFHVDARFGAEEWAAQLTGTILRWMAGRFASRFEPARPGAAKSS